MKDRAFVAQIGGSRLTTAEIYYYRPDARSLLQQFVWQDYDLPPDFPLLFQFLEHWQRELEGALHSISISHQGLLKPAEWHAVDGVIHIRR
ncbi:usg protein [Sphingomonas limnosediminicola]|uniref:Usg protein n=1 Tax=Sphingomonas limnosediminicola TaxID=940133 RepID=A0ABP7LKK2_9SPHN